LTVTLSQLLLLSLGSTPSHATYDICRRGCRAGMSRDAGTVCYLAQVMCSSLLMSTVHDIDEEKVIDRFSGSSSSSSLI